MAYHFRCSSCRGRNVMPRDWRDYKRPKRCKHCGHQRFYLDKERTFRSCCSCDGAYHWGKHRPGSPMCFLNPTWKAHRARRHGEADDVIQALMREARAMSNTDTLPGFDPAPTFKPEQNFGCVGLLWMPARRTSDGAALEVWVAPAPGGLPVLASLQIDAADFHASARAAELEQRLQAIGTPVLVRGFGLRQAVVDGRECLRFGLATLVQCIPDGDYAASLASARAAVARSTSAA